MPACPLMRETHPMHPPTSHRGVGELCHQLPNRHLLAPRGLAWPFLDVLDESGEHSDLEISRSAGQKDIVGMPIQRRHSRLQRLFDVLCHPPVHSSFVVADGDYLSTRSNSKLILLRRPADAGGCSVDPEKYKGVFPSAIVLFHPNVGIPISCASDNPVGLWGPVNAGDS